MKSKRVSLFFVILLVFQTIASGVISPSLVSAEGDDQSVIRHVSVKDETGQDVSKDELEGEVAVDVHVDWSTSGVTVEAGHTDSVVLDEALQVSEQQDGTLTVDAADETIEVGTFNLETDGTLTITFAEAIEDHADVDGTIVVAASIEGEKEEVEADEAEQDESAANNEEAVDETDSSDEAGMNTSETADEATDDNDADNASASNENNAGSEDNDDDESEEADTNDDKDRAEDGNPETNESDDKTSNNAQNVIQDEEKHGFNLELDKITDTDGEEFDEQHPMDPHQEFKLKLDWVLEDGHNYVAGDTETFDLPKGIKINENIEVELTDDSGQVIANAVVTPDKKVELTFTDFVEGHSAVSGWMEIISTLDTEEVEEEDGEVVIDPIGEEGELRIPIEKSNKDKTIEKNGTPNKGYNADEINWQVIVNKNKTSLEDAKVTDELPEGTEYKEGSLIVTKLKVDLNGNVLGDGEEVEIEPEFSEDGELIVPLGDTNDAYRVEYVTEITDDEQKHFENNAKLTDDELDDVSAKSTVTINRGESIKKSAATGYNPKTGIIEWEIEFNFNQKDLSDVTLEDAWTPEGALELVEDSLKFQEVTIDENGHAHNEGNAVDFPNDGANLNQVDDGFEVTGISTDKAYKVTYQTKVTDRVLDPIDVSNTAGFEGESDGSGTHVGQFYGSKSAGTIDYAAKTIDWKIEINHDEYPMEKISVEDTLGDGLTLQEDSIQITVDGQEYEGDFNLSGDNPFTIDFPEDFTTDKKIEIHYKTEFDADNVTDHIAKNKADITWTPEGEDDPITKKVEAETPLNKHTEDNSWKNGSYNPETKEITWTIYTNYRENDIGNLIVKDEPQQNQQIVKDSAVVTELNVAANGDITEGDTVDGIATIDEDANTLEVNIGETSKAYKIEYKTSLEGLDDMKDEYTNQAEVFDGEESLSEIDAKVGVVKDSKYGSKSGYQYGKQVHWSIDVNLVQQQIKNLTLVDTISDNQAYLEDSIKVYHANIDGNGHASKGEEVSSDEYDLTIDDTEFTVEWKDDVERAFIVEYSTLFFEKHNGNVRNDYVITGDSIEEGSDDSSDGHEVTISQLGSGGGEGTAGYLVINKVDATHGQDETSLEGAEFDLVDADTGNVLKSGVTDENGQIDFGRLLFGDYQLKETKVPEGYVTPEVEQTITIDKAYTPGDDKEGFEYTVENYQPVFAVELFKTDDEGNALEDAEFTLFDAEDNKIATATTDEDGKILFEDLEEAGTYYVQETKAPAGYVLDETKHWIDVGEKEKEPVTVLIENNVRGIVKLTKTDQDTGDALEGVEFELQKENAFGEYETVETYTTDENGVIKTSNTLEAGNYQFVEVEGLDGYRTNDEPITFAVDVTSTEDQEYEMTNEQHKAAVKLVKKDAATGVTLEGAEFKLVDSDGEVVHENLVTNPNGEIEVDDLFLGDYQLIETKAPEGYELDETPIDIEMTEDNQVIEKTMTNNKITNITVEKKWNNDGGDTTPVTVKLLPTDQTEELNEENDWKATFKDLRVYDESGEEINYEVEELNVDGYESTVTGDSADGFVVTNTELTSVSGTKTWLDNESEERPDEVIVRLLANEDEIDTTEVNEASDWEYEFTDLVKYDESGEEIAYTIEEVGVDGYETTIDGFDIANLRVAEAEVTGTKIWLDDNSEDRPESITVKLLANDDEIDEVDVTAASNWEYAFTELPKYDDQGVEITYKVDEESVEGYEKSIEGNDITNLRVGTTEIDITKLWKDEQETDRPETIDVNLLRNGEFYKEYEVTEENDWKLTITDLPEFDEEGVAYEYTVKEHDVPGYAADVDDFDITNTRTDMKIIEITKTWLDDDSTNRPDSIEVELFRSITDGDQELVETITLTEEGEWLLEVTDLPAFDDDGKAYTYEIDEKEVEGYETSVNGFDLTNLRAGETAVNGTKTWLDDDSKNRPESITVELFANGSDESIDEVEVTADSDWEYAFTKLPKYDDQGKEIVYTIDETESEGYEKSIDDFDITNLRVGTTEVEVTKSWKDENETDRPETINVNLLQNGDFYEEYEVTKDNDWELEITDLPEFDEEGVAYEYMVKEHDVPGYAADVDGFDITNTREDVKTIELSKTWLDNDDATEDRPESIEVKLYRSIVDGDKERVETYTLTSEGDWKLVVEDLPAFDDDGKAYTYEIEEKSLEGYEAQINGFDITNVRTGTTELSGTKTWLDNDDVTGDRPESITVQVLNGEKVVQEQKVKANDDDEWNYTFIDLPEFDEEGKEIEYTVEEIVPEGYEATVDGNDITNLRVGTVNVAGEKTWVEEDDQYRPDSITVNLLVNGELEDYQEITSNEDGKWSFEFTELAQFDEEGKEIQYTIEEESVKGYTSDIEDFNITNTQETIELSGTKTWLDNDDVTGDRPDFITVQVMNQTDSEPVQEQEVTENEDGEWNYTFTDLPEFDKEGNEIDYTINELPVPGYETDVDGTDITNTRTDEVDVKGTKTWVDNESSDRPDSIIVELLANGEAVDSKEVTAEDDWAYSFDKLDAYDSEGVAIAYTIEEVEVDGYETSINGYDITNLRVGTTTIEGTKTWKDDKAADRPGSITVELLANGEKVDSVEVTAETDWTYSFDNLPGYDEEGRAIEYTVDEVAVDGYETTINGYDITNTLISEEPGKPGKDPADPTTPGNDPEDPEKPVTPEDSNDDSSGGDGEKLPTTSTNVFNLMLFGFGLILVGFVSMFFRRKKNI